MLNEEKPRFAFTPSMFSPTKSKPQTRSQTKASGSFQSGFADSKTNKAKRQNSRDEDLSDRLSKTHLSPPKDDSAENDILEMFVGLSVSELEIDISTLHLIIDDMKARSLTHVNMKDFMTLLDKFGVKKENKFPMGANRTPVQPQPESPTASGVPSEDDSISSSVNSSWSSATMDSPPLRFNFKTPQKIFNFSSPQSKQKAATSSPSVSLFADPVEEAEPPLPPAPPKVAKFLFPTDINEGKPAGPAERPASAVFGSTTAAFNIGATGKPVSKLGGAKAAKGKLHKTQKKPSGTVPAAGVGGLSEDPPPTVPPFTLHSSPLTGTNKRMSTGSTSTDNEMEESTSPVQQPPAAAASENRGVPPFTSTSASAGAGVSSSSSTGSTGFKAFSLGANKAAAAASAKKKRGHVAKGKTAAGMKDLDAMFANIRVDVPAPPSSKTETGAAGEARHSSHGSVVCDSEEEEDDDTEAPVRPQPAAPSEVRTDHLAL
jgi:hypothetical protein